MKFKNIKKSPKRNKNSFVKKAESKKDKKAQQFPNIYRIITEKVVANRMVNIKIRLSWQSKLNKTTPILSIIFFSFLIVILLFGIGVFSFSMYNNLRLFRQISSQQQAIRSKITFWQSIADKYEGYKDAYFRIAILEYQLGDYQKAKENNQKALLLDPNFDEAKQLEAILNKK